MNYTTNGIHAQPTPTEMLAKADELGSPLDCTWDGGPPRRGGPYKMDPAMRENWTRALRSGDYRQTTGTMRKTEEFVPVIADAHLSDDAFCCLGVLCDTIDQSWKPDDAAVWFWADHYDPEMPPTRILPEGPATALARLNDTGDYTFADIADFIEAYL